MCKLSQAVPVNRFRRAKTNPIFKQKQSLINDATASSVNSICSTVQPFTKKMQQNQDHRDSGGY